MRHLNSVHIVGQLHRDVDVRTFNDQERIHGFAIVRLEDPKRVDVIPFSAWEKDQLIPAGYALIRRLHRGATISIEGAMTRRFHFEGGTRRERFEVLCHTILAAAPNGEEEETDGPVVSQVR